MSAGEHKSIFELLHCDGVDKLTDFERPKRMKKKNADKKRLILQKLTERRYLDMKQLETEGAMALSSHHRALMYQLSENIENFLVFQELLERIQDIKKKDGYKITGWMGAGLRTFGGAIRSATVGGGSSSSTTSSTPSFQHLNLQEALDMYIKKKSSYAKVGGNFFRKVGEKLSGETTTIMRVIKRTLEKKNPFLKTLPHVGSGLVDPDSPQRTGFEEEEEDEDDSSTATPMSSEDEGTIHLSLSEDDVGTTPALNLIEGKDEELSSLVFALLKNFDGTGPDDDPSLYYIEFLLNYGFSRFGTEDLRVPYFYDQMFFLGLSKYVFYEHFVKTSYNSQTKREKLEKLFISQCQAVEKKYTKKINFQKLTVDVETITFSEVKNLKDEHMSSKNNESVKMEEIRQLKEELEKRDEKDRIYTLAFRKMQAHWEKYKMRYEKQFGHPLPQPRQEEEESEGEDSSSSSSQISPKKKKSGSIRRKNGGGVHEALLTDEDDDEEEFLIQKKKNKNKLNFIEKIDTESDFDDDDDSDFAIVPKKKKKKKSSTDEENEIMDQHSIFDMDEFQASLRDFPTPNSQPKKSQTKEKDEDEVLSILKSVHDMNEQEEKKKKKKNETDMIFEDVIPVTTKKVITNKKNQGENEEDDDNDMFAEDVRVTDVISSYDELFEKIDGEEEEFEGERSTTFLSLTKTDKDI